jgi:glycosyltransferase involved in cell wall biosynthesis
MKIVIAHESVDTAGGVETYLGALVPALQARSHEVALAYHKGCHAAAFPVDPEQWICVQELGTDAAIAALRAWKPDVVFSHNMGPLDVERRLVREWPVVKMMHGYFGTCISGSKSFGAPWRQACHRTFGVGCLAMYLPRQCGRRDPRSLVRGYRWAADQQKLLPHYAAVIVASGHMRAEFEQHGVAHEKLHVVPLFSTLEAGGACGEAERDTVLFAARMTALKGGDVLLAAAARASHRIGRPVRVIMAGDGPQRNEWRRLAATLGIPTEFPGWIGASDREAEFRRASVLAVPSLWPEPFGLVGLEAGSIGIPAVAFDAGGIREWLVPGESGLLVPPSEGVEGFARALTLVLSDSDLRGRLAGGARSIAARLSTSTHIDRLEMILRHASSV